MRTPKISTTALLIGLFTLTGIANAQNAKLLPVTPAELPAIEKKLDSTLLPNGSTSPDIIDSKQVFRLVGENTVQLTVVPVMFDRAPGSAVAECGVYLIPENGSGSFLWTVGKHQPATDIIFCRGVQAIGLQPTPGSNPALIVIFKAEDGDGDFRDPFVLFWDKQSKTYQVDDDWTQRILDRGIEPTIQNIRQLISKPN